CSSFKSATAAIVARAGSRSSSPRSGCCAAVGCTPVQIVEIMTESVVAAPPETPVQEVAALMRDRNVGSVVLVDDSGRPVGMVTDRDLAVGVLAEAGDPGAAVASCATSPVVTGEPGMQLE